MGMFDLSEEGRMQLGGLFRQIIQQNPPLEVLNLRCYSDKNDRFQNIGEFILESILDSRIKSIRHLYLALNSSWFQHPDTLELNVSNENILSEIIAKQVDLEDLNLGKNGLSSNATQQILTRIAAWGDRSPIKKLWLSEANFDSNDSAEMLA